MSPSRLALISVRSLLIPPLKVASPLSEGIRIETDAPSTFDLAPVTAALIGKPLSSVEKHYIQRTLELTGGKRAEAAQMLGIGERTLFRKIKEYGLK